MKKLSVMMFGVLFSTISFSQTIKEKDVPTSVKNAFQQKYPQANVEKWEKEGANYEAEFDFNEVDQSVLIDVQGNIIETEIEIMLSELPKSVTEYIKTNHKGQTIKEATKISDSKGTITYEVEIKGKDLIFDRNGSFIKSTND